MHFFATAWALATLVDAFAFPGWASDPVGWVLIGSALATLWDPGRIRILAAATLAWALWTMPYLANHVLLSGIVGLTVLVSSRPRDAVRFEVVAMYLVAAFHKLNTAYLDPEGSCAVVAAVGIGLPTFPGLPEVSIGIELLIPLLLFVRPAYGFVLAALFHGLLALHPNAGVTAFSITTLALLASFVDGDVRLPRGVVGAIGVLLAVQGAAIVVASGRLGHLVLPVVAGSVGVLLTFLLLTTPRAPRPSIDLGFIGVLLILASASGPYLGWKTTTSLAMFSNLETVRSSNHLLVPHLPGPKDDVVRIVSADAMGRRCPDRPVEPRSCFRRGEWVVFHEVRRHHHLGPVVRDRTVTPLPTWSAKLRRYGPPTRGRCRW